MLPNTTGAELSTAIVDLLTSIISIILVFIVANQKGDKKLRFKWTLFLALMGVGNFAGFIFHGYQLEKTVGILLWTGLYPVMYAIAQEFITIAVYDLSDGKYPQKKHYVISSIICSVFCVASIITGFFVENEIRLFVVYAALIDLPALGIFAYIAIKRKSKAARILFLIIIPQLFGLYFQLVKSGGFHLIWDFNHDGIYHLCLLVSVVIIALAAMVDIKDKAKANEQANS